MNKLSNSFLTTLFLVFLSSSIFAQNSFFTDAGANALAKTSGKRVLSPEKFRTSDLNVQGMKTFLWSLPSENNVPDKKLTPVMELPMPNGVMAKFHVWESSVMEPGLAAKYPEIKTFAGQGIDDPYASVRLDYNPYFGFSAQILSANGDVYIDPYAKGDIDHYISYYTKDNKRNPSFICYTSNNPAENQTTIEQRTEAACRGTQLYTYRLALACTGEYAVAVCSPSAATVAATLAAMTTSVNRVDGVYETELSIRMVLVANTDQLIYLNGSTDPYTNSSPSALLSQNQTNIDAIIGTANYDFGHVFTTGGGGLSALGVVCVNGSKAESETGLPNPVGDNFDIDYVAHEMGHEFGANHPFNSSTGNCGGGNRNAATAYEVGSGTTIMAYAGICSTDDIQPHSDPFFHAISFDEISNYVSGTGGTCASITNTGNHIPVITAMNNNGANIPLNTPFTLTGSATDPDGDPLTYCWEEWDLGPSTAWNGGNANTTSPLFKSRPPKTTGSRTFPDSSLIAANYVLSTSDLNGLVMDGNKGETLPTQARTMNFKLTVRDNHGGVTSGGIGGCQSGFNSAFTINTIAGTGPFIVTAPNGGESYPSGSVQTITWNVAGTDVAPISTANVKISLSTDGGLTYPIILTASTPNDGSEALTLPNTATSTARIKIEAIGNIFFDISDANFAIAPAGAPVINTQPKSSGTCVGSNSTFSVLASGLNLAYQWQLSTNGGTTFSDISTATSSSYTVNGVALSMNNYQYRCVVTGSIAPPDTSTTAVLTVIAPVSITSQPANSEICAGSNTSFNVSGSNTQTIIYQWQVNTGSGFSSISNGGVYSGATTATLTITGATASMDGNQYRCQLSNATCTAPTASGTATLTVHPLPTISLVASPLTSLLPGQTTTLTTTPGASAGGTLAIAWLYNNVVIPNSGNTRTVTVEQTGNYQTTIRETWPSNLVCTNQSSTVTIDAPVSDKLFIFPSPNNGQFTVSYYNSESNASRTVTIFDSKGSKVYQSVFTVSGPYTLMQIDLTGKQAGIYYVVVSNASGKKLVDGKVMIH